THHLDNDGLVHLVALDAPDELADTGLAPKVLSAHASLSLRALARLAAAQNRLDTSDIFPGLAEKARVFELSDSVLHTTLKKVLLELALELDEVLVGPLIQVTEFH